MMSSKQFCDQSLSGEQNTPGNITDRGHRSVNTGWQHSSDRTRILRGFFKLKIQIFVLRWEKEEKEALPLHRFFATINERLPKRSDNNSGIFPRIRGKKSGMNSDCTWLPGEENIAGASQRRNICKSLSHIRNNLQISHSVHGDK